MTVRNINSNPNRKQLLAWLSVWLSVWFFWTVNPQGLTIVHGQWGEEVDCLIIQRVVMRIKYQGLYVSPCSNDKELLKSVLLAEELSKY